MASELKLTDVRIDGGTQPRAKIDLDVVAEYAERLDAGDVFPPVEVVFDGKDYWLWDGFHRYHGHARAKRKTIAVSGLLELDETITKTEVNVPIDQTLFGFPSKREVVPVEPNKQPRIEPPGRREPDSGK